MCTDKIVEFFVEGVPVPQGSVKHVGNGRLVHANPKLGFWRTKIGTETYINTHGIVEQIEDAVAVDVVFYMPRPKTHFINGDGVRLRPTAPLYHTKEPDLDKLLRAVCDGISKNHPLLADDSLVSRLQGVKLYVSPGQSPGAHISILKI